MVEVRREGDRWVVQLTYREPFEDIFEIAVHTARFVDRAAAQRLADRVTVAVRAAYPKSPSCALDPAQWIYRSSAYRSLAKMATDNPRPYDVERK